MSMVLPLECNSHNCYSVFRHGFAEAEEQQRVHDCQAQRRRSGHAVHVTQTHQRNLGVGRTQNLTHQLRL